MTLLNLLLVTTGKIVICDNNVEINVISREDVCWGDYLSESLCLRKIDRMSPTNDYTIKVWLKEEDYDPDFGYLNKKEG